MSNASGRIRNRDNGIRGRWRGGSGSPPGVRAYVKPVADGRKGRIRMAKVTWATWRSKLNNVNAILKIPSGPIKELKDMTEGERREIEARYGAKIKQEHSP